MKCNNCNDNEATQYSKYTSGEFCSRGCASSYSTKNKRLEINEKVSKKLKGFNRGVKVIKVPKKRKKKVKKDKFCSSCNVNIGNNSYKTLCPECKPFVKYKKLYEKVNVLCDNLQESNEAALKVLIREYFTNEKSMLMIKDEYGIMLNSLKFFFEKNSIRLRSVSKGVKLAIECDRLTPSTNNTYNNGYHISWDGIEYFYRSSYELRMMIYLDSIKELYLYEKLKIKYTYDDELRTHITDFYLPKRNLIIEVKGEYFQDRDKEIIKIKKLAAISEGYYYTVIGDLEIKEYENNSKLLG